MGGAVSGLAVWGLGVAGVPTATLWGAVTIGAVSGAAGGAASKVTENALTPCTEWNQGVLEAGAIGGIFGGVTGGLWYGAGQLWQRFRLTTLEQQLKAVAESADRAIPGTGHVAGTLKHTEFRNQVDALHWSGVETEATYLNGAPADYGARGGVRLDVVVKARDWLGNEVVKAGYAFKTGAAELTARRIPQILAHLPNSAPIKAIKP